MAYVLLVHDKATLNRIDIPPHGISIGASGTVRSARRNTAGRRPVILPYRDVNGSLHYALVHSPRTPCYVNGDDVLTLHCLSHRDFIVCGETAMFFDSTIIPQPESLSGVHEVPCAYCRGSTQPGSGVVCCPNCGLVYHHDHDNSCWLANNRCACGQITDLDQQPDWIPSGFTLEAANDDA